MRSGTARAGWPGRGGEERLGDALAAQVAPHRLAEGGEIAGLGHRHERERAVVLVRVEARRRRAGALRLRGLRGAAWPLMLATWSVRRGASKTSAPGNQPTGMRPCSFDARPPGRTRRRPRRSACRWRRRASGRRGRRRGRSAGRRRGRPGWASPRSSRRRCRCACRSRSGCRSPRWRRRRGGRRATRRGRSRGAR